MKIVYMGTGEIGLPALRDLIANPEHDLAAVFTQPDKPAGRGQVLVEPEIKKVARAHSIPVFQPKKIRDPEWQRILGDLAPDLAVVMAYGQILPRAVLDTPRIACINLHASLLPAYRGAAPIQAAIRAGDHESGITVIYMDAGLDTGDILLARSIPIGPGETGQTLHDRLADLAPSTLRAALEALDSGSAPSRTPQDSAAATHSPKLFREDGRIDWSQPAETIERTIRAYDPWPGTFTQWQGGRQLKIFPPARIVPGAGASQPAAPGTVLAASEAGILIAAGGTDGLLVTEVQAEGRRRLPAADFLRGAALAPGDRFE